MKHEWLAKIQFEGSGWPQSDWSKVPKETREVYGGIARDVAGLMLKSCSSCTCGLRELLLSGSPENSIGHGDPSTTRDGD